MIYDDVFSYDTFEKFPGGYFDFVKTNRQIYLETFDYAMKNFRSFKHAFFLKMSFITNGSFEIELVYDQSVNATNYEDPLPEKVVEMKALQQFEDVELLFGSHWVNSLEYSTQIFKSAINMIAWTLKDQAAPISLTIDLPTIKSGAWSGKLVADLEPLASLPAICDVKLQGNRHWRWVIQQWDTKRWAFLLNGKKQEPMDELMDGFLIRIVKSIESMAANAN